MERHFKINSIAVDPGPAQGEICTWRRLHPLVHAIDLNIEAVGRPRRDPHFDVKPATAVNRQGGIIGIGIIGGLGDDDISLVPSNGGWNIEIDIQSCIVSVFEVNGILELGVALQPGAVTTAETIHIGIAETFGLANMINGDMISIAGIILSYRSQDIVIKSPLIIIHILRILVVHEKLTGQFQQVISTASLVLSGGIKTVTVKGVRLRRKIFAVIGIPGASRAADTVSIAVDHHIPEICGNIIIFSLTAGVIFPKSPGHLRDMLVSVQAAEVVYILGQAAALSGTPVKDIHIVEHLGRSQVALIAGILIQLGQDFIHPSIFTGDIGAPHSDQRSLRDSTQALIYPKAHALGNGQSFLIAFQSVGIQQSGNDLMHGIIWGPNIAITAAVSGTVFQHDKLVGRVGAEETFTPVPIVGPDPGSGKVRIIAALAGSIRNGGRIGISWTAIISRFAGHLGECI